MDLHVVFTPLIMNCVDVAGHGDSVAIVKWVRDS